MVVLKSGHLALPYESSPCYKILWANSPPWQLKRKYLGLLFSVKVLTSAVLRVNKIRMPPKRHAKPNPWI